jgi:hypothetical protein
MTDDIQYPWEVIPQVWITMVKMLTDGIYSVNYRITMRWSDEDDWQTTLRDLSAKIYGGAVIGIYCSLAERRYNAEHYNEFRCHVIMTKNPSLNLMDQ